MVCLAADNSNAGIELKWIYMRLTISYRVFVRSVMQKTLLEILTLKGCKGNGLLIMYNCVAIKEMAHTNKKNHWYSSLRAIFIFWTGSLQQHDISRAPCHMVPQASLRGVPVARETDEVKGSPGGRGLSVGSRLLRRGAELSCASTSAT